MELTKHKSAVAILQLFSNIAEVRSSGALFCSVRGGLFAFRAGGFETAARTLHQVFHSRLAELVFNDSRRLSVDLSLSQYCVLRTKILGHFADLEYSS